jgi:hypothetical protein
MWKRESESKWKERKEGLGQIGKFKETKIDIKWIGSEEKGIISNEKRENGKEDELGHDEIESERNISRTNQVKS